MINVEIADQLALGEFESQNALHAANPVNAKSPVAWGKLASSPPYKAFFLTHYVSFREYKAPRPEILMEMVRRFQSNGKSPNGMFGFGVTTFQGCMPLQVDWCPTWSGWFARQLRDDLNSLARARGTDPEMNELSDRICGPVVSRILGPLDEGEGRIKPVLCHGDLWPGNIGIDEETGELLAFDAGAIYAHAECQFQSFPPRHASYFQLCDL